MSFGTEIAYEAARQLVRLTVALVVVAFVLGALLAWWLA